MLFRSLVSMVLLFYLFTIIEWNRLIDLLSGIKQGLLLLAPILLLIGFLFSATRWHYLLASLKIRQKIKELYIYYLMGVFYSIFLPGIIGGDIIRIGFCARETKSSIGIITTSVFVERVCGVIALFVMGSLVIFSLPSEFLADLGYSIVKALPAVTALCLILMVTVFIIGRKFHESWLIEEKRSGWVKKLLQILNLVICLPYTTVLSLFVFSALFQAADILASFAIAKALNIAVPLNLFFVIIPIVYICTLLPVSIGGLGVREGILVYLLAKMGVLSSDAVALSFLIYFNRVAIGSIGGLAQIFWRRKEMDNLSTAVKKTVSS